MLNFAERTGSGAVMIVWSFLFAALITNYINSSIYSVCIIHDNHTKTIISRTLLEVEKKNEKKVRAKNPKLTNKIFLIAIVSFAPDNNINNNI